MRILTLFVKYVVMITLVMGVTGLFIREAFLFWGTQQVRMAENKMELIAGARFKSEYDKQCRDKGGGRGAANVQATQLRFTSDTEYQVEVVCEFFSNDPIVIETYKLPMFVKKVPGQAGFVWNPDSTSGVVLEVYHRRTTLVLENEKFRMVQGKASIPGSQPQATCGGFGYACCAAENEVGEGDLFKQVSDCPTQCFPTCVPRPTVLRFVSDPNPDLKTRTATVPKGSPIIFYFVTDPGKTGQATTQLQLGDGSIKDFTEFETDYTHQYQCDQAECAYTAKLVVTDSSGVISVPTAISTINVVVR